MRFQIVSPEQLTWHDFRDCMLRFFKKFPGLDRDKLRSAHEWHSHVLWGIPE